MRRRPGCFLGLSRLPFRQSRRRKPGGIQPGQSEGDRHRARSGRRRIQRVHGYRKICPICSSADPMGTVSRCTKHTHDGRKRLSRYRCPVIRLFRQSVRKHSGPLNNPVFFQKSREFPALLTFPATAVAAGFKKCDNNFDPCNGATASASRSTKCSC